MANQCGLAKRVAQPDISPAMMNQPLPTDPTADRALLLVEGPDAGAFLNSLLTQAISAEPGDIRYAALLSAQGKVAFDLFVLTRDAQSYWLDVAGDQADLAFARLKPFRLGRKLSLSILEGWRGRWCVDAPGGGAINAPDPRPPAAALGTRAYAPAGVALPKAVSHGARLQAGLPDGALDLGGDELFALEALLEELAGVDFHKGCFPGQENVSRMKRRATTRKKLCRIRYEGAAPAFGAAIMAGAAEVGAMRSAAGGFGLAHLRLDRVREAAAAGLALECAGAALTLDAPEWLLWPVEGRDA